MTEKETADQKLLSLMQHQEFINTDPWRVFRIMGEFVTGFDKLADINMAVTIFGSARTRPEEPMYRAASDLACLLGKEGFSIITGGGPGIMEAGNKGAMEAGVPSIGLNIELPFEQHVNPYVTQTMEFHYFFTRKTMFLKYACGFVIFPGGFGTMDELFESLTLIQTGKIHNFPVVLFGTAYWKGLTDWLRNTMMAGGKISQGDMDLLILTDSVAEAGDYIVRSVREGKWRLDQEENARQTARNVLKKNPLQT